MIKHRESTLKRPPTCPKDGVHFKVLDGTQRLISVTIERGGKEFPLSLMKKD